MQDISNIEHNSAIAALNSKLEHAGDRETLLLLKEAQDVVDTAAKIGIGRLLDLLHHHYWLVRSMACEVIGDMDYMPGSSQLAFLLKDENPTVRSRSREAIEAIHDFRLSDEVSDELFRSVTVTDFTPDKFPREPRVFISYSRKDSNFVNRLVDVLKLRNLNIWFDKIEIADDDAPERQIIDAIEPGIRGSDYLALILSPYANESWWVERELRIARIHRNVRNPIKVLALLIETTEIPKILTNYSPLTQLEFSDFQDHNAFADTLLKQIDFS